MTRVNWPLVSALLIDACCWAALVGVAAALRMNVHS